MQSHSPVRFSSHGNGNGKKKPCARDRFRQFSSFVSSAVGSPITFVLASGAIVAWGACGPLYRFSNTWQLVINTGTTIITFLMVFLIQNTQNRDARAIHLKLDELIRGLPGPRNKLVDLENCTDEELEKLEREFGEFRKRRRHRMDNDTAAANHRS